MDAKSAIKQLLSAAEMVGLAYLSGLTDDQCMQRPHQRCNHINWQVGHLILSEHEHIERIASGSMPELPEGFKEKYSKTAAQSDDPSAFCSMAELLDIYHQQRQGTLKVLESQSADDLDIATGVPYAPTRAALIQMQGSHWLMHCGQWVVIRREYGLPIVI